MEHETQPALACPKCNLRRMMPDLPVRAHSSSVAKVVVVLKKQVATFWRSAEHTISPVTAHVCGNCGYTEFYSEDPQQLWEVWQQINR